MSSIAMFPANLLLSSANLSTEGVVLAGHVINGGWWYRTNGTHHFAYRDDRDDKLSPVSVYPIEEPQYLVYVPSELSGYRQYNEALDWARLQPPTQWDDLKEKMSQDVIKWEQRKREIDESDDIPF